MTKPRPPSRAEPTLDPSDFPQIWEDAAFAAWPALHEQRLQGWRLRFANGYTQRANSANAAAARSPLSLDLLHQVEAFYMARGVKPVWRLVSHGADPAVDDLLASQGYRRADPSWVMTRTLTAPVDMGSMDSVEQAAHWLPAFARITGLDAAHHATLLQMLGQMADPKAMALGGDPDKPHSCALGVLHQGLVGLFAVATQAPFRRQGHARSLCQLLLGWGYAHGATQAYLQVAANNEAAIHLYETMGFARRYHYWYRIRPD